MATCVFFSITLISGSGLWYLHCISMASHLGFDFQRSCTPQLSMPTSQQSQDPWEIGGLFSISHWESHSCNHMLGIKVLIVHIGIRKGNFYLRSQGRNGSLNKMLGDSGASVMSQCEWSQRANASLVLSLIILLSVYLTSPLKSQSWKGKNTLSGEVIELSHSPNV